MVWVVLAWCKRMDMQNLLKGLHPRISETSFGRRRLAHHHGARDINTPWVGEERKGGSWLYMLHLVIKQIAKKKRRRQRKPAAVKKA